MIKLNRIGVFSMGKVSAVYAGLFGLVVGLIISIFSLITIILGSGDLFSSSSSSYSLAGPVIGIVTGLGALICYPVFYAVSGFIGGIISAFIINLALKFAGGLELEAEGVLLQPAPPAPKIEPVKPAPQ